MTAQIVLEENEIRGLLTGPLPNKSNGRRIVSWGGHLASIKNRKALSFETDFIRSVKASGIGSSNPLFAEKKLKLAVWVWPDSMRRDLDCELLPDCLQKAGLIKNDRAIWEKHYKRIEVDKLHPRIAFVISKIESLPASSKMY